MEIKVNRPKPQCTIIPVIREVLGSGLPIEYLKLHFLNIGYEEIRYISQVKTIRQLEFINSCEPLQLENKFERYVIQLASNLPNLEVVMFQTEYQIELILTDKNIHQIEQDLQKVIQSETLHMHELNSSNNKFTDHYSTKTRLFPASLDKREFISDVSLIIRKVNNYDSFHFTLEELKNIFGFFSSF